MTALSPKQQKVCDLVVQGMTSHQIALRLGVSIRTVEEHRTAIYRRMEVRNVVELVRKVLEASK